MFLGTYTLTRDDQNPITLSAKFHDFCAGKLPVTNTHDHPGTLVLPDILTHHTMGRAHNEPTPPQGCTFCLSLVPSPHEHDLDQQGRITLSAHHRHHGPLIKDCVVIEAIEDVKIGNDPPWMNNHHHEDSLPSWTDLLPEEQQ